MREDKGVDALERAEVREDLEVDVRVCFFRLFNDARDIFDNMGSRNEEVGEYLDFHGTRFGQIGDGGIDLRAGEFQKGAGYPIKDRP